jgi:acylphosphatase
MSCGSATVLSGRIVRQTRFVKSPKVVRVRVIVEGRVQGVFYRDSCCREARRLGVRGWVRNRADRSVEVVAEGPRDRVDQLLDWCRQGPPSATVSKISVTDEVPRAEREFHVEYG